VRLPRAARGRSGFVSVFRLNGKREQDMRANLQLIKQRLFDCARERIARDYQFNVPGSPDELSEQVLRSLDQQAFENAVNQEYENDFIFRAVVRTIGNNSRKWTTFLAMESNISRVLSNYCVEEVVKNPPKCFELAKLLPGQTATADASAVLNWAQMLSENHHYYANVARAAREIHQRFGECEGEHLTLNKLFLCVVAHFADPSRRAKDRKWWGMGFTLGSEFLRNLHWNGFKPDRHIKRLLNRWTDGQVDVLPAAREVQRVIRRSDAALLDNLRWSLIGMEITPDDHRANFSQFDNLIWLLGVYVEKKGKESEYNYLLI
jgi:hypothetical protein